ncbi:MAG: hypothetical protein LBC61_01525 [Candidatus Peribacteria bacterium]|jgi:hypothetical protein|nr:hypothetical protein [Candidatus Peribacteria bacterium]
MKKLLTILLICAFANLTFAYTPTNSEIKLLNQVKPEIIKIYNKDVNKAYSVKNNINSFLDKYKKKESAIYVLNFINNVTLEYIKDYESKLKAEQEKEKEETIKYQNIDDIITSQNDKLFVLNNNNTKTIASFEIEPKYDHLYLQNVYLENI